MDISFDRKRDDKMGPCGAQTGENAEEAQCTFDLVLREIPHDAHWPECECAAEILYQQPDEEGREKTKHECETWRDQNADGADRNFETNFRPQPRIEIIAEIQRIRVMCEGCELRQKIEPMAKEKNNENKDDQTDPELVHANVRLKKTEALRLASLRGPWCFSIEYQSLNAPTWKQ
jgi:hypothetical protein